MERCGGVAIGLDVMVWGVAIDLDVVVWVCGYRFEWEYEGVWLSEGGASCRSILEESVEVWLCRSGVGV